MIAWFMISAAKDKGLDPPDPVEPGTVIFFHYVQKIVVSRITLLLDEFSNCTPDLP